MPGLGQGHQGTKIKGVKLIPACFRVPVSEFRNSGESETRLSPAERDDGGQVYSLCLGAFVAT